jgi:hypothetical protein
MKTFLISVLAVFVALNAWADGTPAIPATQTEVNTGTIHNKYVAPDTLAGWTGGGGGGAAGIATQNGKGTNTFLQSPTNGGTFRMTGGSGVGTMSIAFGSGHNNWTISPESSHNGNITLDGAVAALSYSAAGGAFRIDSSGNLNSPGIFSGPFFDSNVVTAAKQAIPLFHQTNITAVGGTYNSWPISALDTNGDFVTIFAAGNRHTATNRSIYLTRSSNQGYTWSTPSLLYTNGAVDVAAPGFAFGISSSGRYILAYAGTIVPSGVVTNAVILLSDDQGANWTPATSFQSFTGYDNTNVPSGRIITLAANRLCMGYAGFSNSFDASIAYALTSDDNGATWNTNFVVNSLVSGFREPNFVYLGNSNVLCMVRRDQAFANQANIFYQAHSTNNGTSWVVDGPVSMGFSTAQRQPCAMYAYGSDAGRRVVLAYGNRETTQLEVREVSAWDLLNNLTNVWLYARPETLGTICTGQGDGGYGTPIGFGQSGDCVIPYFYSNTNNLTVPANGEIRFATRSSRLAVPQYPQVLSYSTAVAGVTNSTTETDMVNFTIPANSLFGNHAYQFDMTGYAFNNAAAAITNRLRVYFGSTLIYDQQMDATIFAQGTGIRPYRFSCTLKSQNSLTAQDLIGSWWHGSSTVPTVGAGNINATAFGGGVFGNRVTLNAQTNNAFRVTFTLTPASANLWFDRDLVSVTYY